MQRFLDFFEEKRMDVELTIPYEGKCFTITQAQATYKDGTPEASKFIAEGVARRSADLPDNVRGEEISGGRAIKALYLKVRYHEKKRDLLAELELPGITEAKRQSIQRQLQTLERRHKSLVHGHIHLLMG